MSRTNQQQHTTCLIGTDCSYLQTRAQRASPLLPERTVSSIQEQNNQRSLRCEPLAADSITPGACGSAPGMLPGRLSGHFCSCVLGSCRPCPENKLLEDTLLEARLCLLVLPLLVLVLYHEWYCKVLLIILLLLLMLKLGMAEHVNPHSSRHVLKSSRGIVP